MKVLFFHTVAPHAKVAPALLDQAWNALRPFQRYVGQAIHTAKKRQTRYQLPWEKVRNLHTIRLEAVDTILRVPRQRLGVRLMNWPNDKAYDLSRPGFCMDRDCQVRFDSATSTPEGLLVKTDTPLLQGESVIWCGVTTSVQEESSAPPPRNVRTLDGRALTLRAEPKPFDKTHWLLVVEGVHEDCTLVVDGDEVEAEDMTSLGELKALRDQLHRSFEVSGGMVRTEELPAPGLLEGDDGLRYRWSDGESSGRQGCWVQLLPPKETDAEDFMDPRAAFCEGDLDAVWTEPRHRKDTTYKVRKVDQDRYQLLLEKYPPQGSTLYLPVDVRNLQLQRRALRQLAEAPLPHHQGLLRLCEDPERVLWPRVEPQRVSTWRFLTRAERDGTDEQRRFVEKVLGTPDFAFLEGPPGSGKTTAICEIVQQLVEKGQRVLLCASTHVAIDNVLERLLNKDSPIDAVRIGNIERVDDNVHATTLDVRKDKLLTVWEKDASMRGFGAKELEEMAERTIIMAANLTCGTTMGIVNHPLFHKRDEDLHIAERPISTMPHWDVLIVDEASKTLIQEFLVPALMAKRWIIVGDVRQLPPFTDRDDIVANLRDLVDEKDNPIFPPDHQRACLLLFRFRYEQLAQPRMRWLFVERPGVIEWMVRELNAAAVKELYVLRVVSKGDSTNSAVDHVTVEQVRTGKPEALKLAAAQWVLIPDDLLASVAEWLPAHLLSTNELSLGDGSKLAEGHVWRMRQGLWLEKHAGRLAEPYHDKDFKFKYRKERVETIADSQTCETDWLAHHDVANELTWRMTRLHELRYSRKDSGYLQQDVKRLEPRATDIHDALEEMQEIGLPSILEVLQEGIGAQRSKRRSALTLGMRMPRTDTAFLQRFESLSYQHRMHPQIAEFSKEFIYQGKALKNANTIPDRDVRLGWNFGPFPSRRTWVNVDGRERGGVNADEIEAMMDNLRQFLVWIRRNGAPNRSSPPFWEVACLSFYAKQERAISEKLKQLTQYDGKTRFRVRDVPIEIVCGTVDRFQGREADLVLLSMRNTDRIGFLDSPNRLNVALTRARQQLLILGRYRYYSDCKISELQNLATRTQMDNSFNNRTSKWRVR